MLTAAACSLLEGKHNINHNARLLHMWNPRARLRQVYRQLHQLTVHRLLQYLRSEEGLPGEQLLQVAMFGNAPRPVMRQKHVQRPLQLLQAVHRQLSDVVGAAHCVFVKGCPLVVALRCMKDPSTAMLSLAI